jgi:hypothetical protein
LILRTLFLQLLVIRIYPNGTVPILPTIETDCVGMSEVPFPPVAALVSCQRASEPDGCPDDPTPERSESSRPPEAFTCVANVPVFRPTGP